MSENQLFTPPCATGFIGAIMVSRAVTVVITIAVAVTVSVATTASLGSIQDQGHVLVFFLPVDFLQFSKHTQFKQSCTNHENSTVSQLLDYLRVGHQFDGRTVNQHIFVLFPYGIYYLFQPVVEQQFRWGLGGMVRQEGCPDISVSDW